ncbi:MAG TPA: VanW family protein [Stellaceae bacterium]|nr:VanW family protein [Stellaceae bacterium]
MSVVPEHSTRITHAPMADWAAPNRWTSAVFAAKAFVHRAHRALIDVASGPRRLSKVEVAGFDVIAGESRSPLWADARPEELAYQRGKVQNLRRATALLDGVVVPAGAVFSFWKQIGRASRRRGFVTGRMLQQGCLVPVTGGGLCQLSNAIYDAALQTGCEIVERHAHSRRVAGSAAALGRDATVAWNYVDLRFRPRHPLRIEARLIRDDLIIRFHAPLGAPATQPERATRPPVARSCATCGEVSCFMHEHRADHSANGDRTAYLVDENWPEFQDYIASSHAETDVFGQPIDGVRWRLPRYRWRSESFAIRGTASVQALRRMIAIRRAAAQGPTRRNAELAGAERVARRLARLLTPDVTRVCVAQSLLPALWQHGHLGGREVEVLMTRLPMTELQARLDTALAAHPERATLGDFRAPATLVAAEAAALAYAARIVTPHRDIAALFPDRATLLEWKLPPAPPQARDPRPRRIAFPGPTVARKGAHALREAARALGLEVVLLGSELEGPEFWRGLVTHKPAANADWLIDVVAVVQPALVEERPRALLAALAAGVPVIATPACGLAAQDGVTLVPSDDPVALIETLRVVLNERI